MATPASPLLEGTSLPPGDVGHNHQMVPQQDEELEGGEEEEGLECRVCRGEAESDRPLYAPCMCAGSIMYTHQVRTKYVSLEQNV